ncbi:MAG: hypothetical protein ACXWJF_13750 [Burkholderiaceae bacterium]
MLSHPFHADQHARECKLPVLQRSESGNHTGHSPFLPTALPVAAYERLQRV